MAGDSPNVFERESIDHIVNEVASAVELGCQVAITVGAAIYSGECRRGLENRPCRGR